MRSLGALLLTRSDIRQVLAWLALIETVRSSLRLRLAGEAAPPVSGQISLAEAQLHLKAGALSSPGAMSVKANLRPQGGLASGFVMVFDPAEGCVAAILDSADITAAWTAALTRLAAETLAAPGSYSLAILGAGPVAMEELAALPTRVPISRGHVWSRSPESADLLARWTVLPVERYASPGETASRATTLVMATPSHLPYLEADDLADGALVLALGADSPGTLELGASVLEGATIIADQQDDVLNVGGSSYLAAENRSSFVAELGELLAAGAGGRPRVKRRAGRIRVFDSVGSAVVDAMVCHSKVALALEHRLGQTFDLSR